jgi:Protein of unknown function (DUF664)
VSDLSSFYPDLQPASERVVLEQNPDFCRRAVVARIEDLDDGGASRKPLPATQLTVGGVVKHLAWAEDRWFVGKLLGQPLPEPWRSAPLADEPDWPFESSRDDSSATSWPRTGRRASGVAMRWRATTPSTPPRR